MPLVYFMVLPEGSSSAASLSQCDATPPAGAREGEIGLTRRI
jgi:hypothetical protein